MASDQPSWLTGYVREELPPPETERGRHPADPTGLVFGETHWPKPRKHELQGNDMSQELYMLIDVTTVENTQVIAVATLRRIQLLGKIKQAQGLKVIAPPLQGRGFSKLDQLPLQYLYWHTCGLTPPDIYAELIESCIKAIKAKFPEDQTPEDELIAEVKKLYPEGDLLITDIDGGTNRVRAPKVPKEPKEPRAPREPGEAPAATSTTGKVWVVADEVLSRVGSTDIKALRTAIIKACEDQGINGSTAATQYSKWKNAKGI